MGPGQRKGTTGSYLRDDVLDVIKQYGFRNALSKEEVRQLVARRRSGATANSVGSALSELYRKGLIERIEISTRRIKWKAKVCES